MSLVTSCPACGTMFRVVPDQLKISEGWVRCGHCAEVFDATAHLIDYEPVPVPEEPPTDPSDLPTQPPDWDYPDPPLPPPPPPPPVRATTAAGMPTRNLADAAARASGGATAASPLAQTSAAARPRAARAADTAGATAEYPPFRRSALDHAEPGTAPAPVAPDSQFKESRPVRESRPPESRPLESSRFHESHPPRPAEEEPDIEQVTFVRQARRQAYWRRPGMRVVLTLLVLLLGAVLLLQVGVQDRDRLAAAYPQLQPWLERMCEVLQCRVGPSRQIEAIAIESSGFNRLRSDTFRLSVTLRNSSPAPVAMPSLELTLTDTQDQAVVRRVLSPEELGARSPVLEGAGEWSVVVGIAVSATGTRIAGYRLLAFYP